MPLTIALFGATGGSGRAFLPKALQRGYRVRALVRTPDKLSTRSDQLDVIEGDILDPEAVSRTVAGCEVIVTLIGQVKGSPADLQTRGIEHLIAAAQQHQVRKIISLTGGGVHYHRDAPKLIDKVFRGMMGLFFKNILHDAQTHVARLQDSGIPYVVVRGPRLTDSTPKGYYRVGYVGIGTGSSITRTDLADFIVEQIESDRYVGDMPFVSN